tara:strand:+ start:9916 stop:10584 length:669 start_codon:yes stop_codon:yes gene_type:complete
MTAQEQQIYNTYLRVSRQVKNKPFKLRKQFDDLPSDKVVACATIDGILRRINATSAEDFIRASYLQFPDDHLDLKHFTTMKAIRSYSLWLKSRKTKEFDIEDITGDILMSAKFIYGVCKENSLELSDYLEFVPVGSNSDIPLFLNNLKQGDISWYILFAIGDPTKYIKRVPNELLEFMFGREFHKTHGLMRTRYLKLPSEVKILIEKALNKIQTKLKKYKKL